MMNKKRTNTIICAMLCMGLFTSPAQAHPPLWSWWNWPRQDHPKVATYGPPIIALTTIGILFGIIWKLRNKNIGIAPSPRPKDHSPTISVPESIRELVPHGWNFVHLRVAQQKGNSCLAHAMANVASGLYLLRQNKKITSKELNNEAQNRFNTIKNWYSTWYEKPESKTQTTRYGMPERIECDTGFPTDFIDICRDALPRDINLTHTAVFNNDGNIESFPGFAVEMIGTGAHRANPCVQF